MKNRIQSKLTFHQQLISILILLFILVVVGSCKKINQDRQSDESNFEKSTTIVPCGTPLTVNLMAGQNIDIGSVTISNTMDSLYITISSEGSWWLKSASVYVGALSGMPQTPTGNPKVGQFPYKKTLNPSKQLVKFAISSANLSPCFIVAVHVEAVKIVNGQPVQLETGWGQGSPMSGANWAMYMNYCLQECNPCVYETINATFYAGQTIDVGDVNITNDEDSIYVNIQLSGDWHIRQLHLYFGTYANMPVNSQNVPVPGQFPVHVTAFQNDQNVTVSYPLAGLPPCYIVAVHGVVHRIVNGELIQAETAWSFGNPFINTNRWGWTTPYCTQICN